MRRFKRAFLFAAVFSLQLFFHPGSATRADEVLSNGGFELGAGPANWVLTQSVVGDPSALINATEQVDSANKEFPSAGLGLLVKPYAGNRDTLAGENKAINVTLSQTFNFSASAVGRTYTFTGNSYFQLDSSNNASTLGVLTPLADYNLNTVVDAADYTVWRDTLGSTSDFRANGTNEGASLDTIDQADYDYWAERFGNAGHGEIPSPTETKFELAFLTSAGDVIGTPATLVLPKNRPTDVFPDDYLMHPPLQAVAPPTTTKIRVSVIATNMVDACTTCTAGQDVFFDNFSLRDSTVNVERLVNGDLNAPGAPVDFSLVKTPEDNVQFTNATFAVHSGNQGLWLRSFNGGDAKAVQTLAATPGTAYDFAAWAKLQPGYIGLDPQSSTDTFALMEFLDGSGMVIAGPDGTKKLDLRTLIWSEGMDNQGDWQLLPALHGIAPAGTASVRVSVGATGMGDSGFSVPQSAMFDDLSLIASMAGGASISLVPEPNCLLLISLACGILGLGQRRR